MPVLDSLISFFTSNLFILEVVTLLAWVGCLKGKFCPDDIDGVSAYSDRLYPERKDKDGQIIEEKLVNTYEFNVEGKTRLFGNLSFNPYVGFPGNVIRFIRLNLGKKYAPIAKNSKGHDVYGFIQSPFRHHIINLVLHLANCFLLNRFLSGMYNEEVAFWTTLLFCVSPLLHQCVAWISGVGYVHSLFWTLVTLNVIQSSNLFLTIPVVAVATFISTSQLIVGGFTWPLLFILGKWPEGIVCALISLYTVFFHGKEIVSYRANQFKKQQMTEATSLSWRRIIVAIKTFGYHVKMYLYPMNLGLFHTYNYNFTRKTEQIDRYFFLGLATLLSMGGLVYWSNFNPLVMFPIAWVLLYTIPFYNFITAHQFVTERYVATPSLGFYLIVAFIFQWFPAFLPFYAGLLMMRTIVHLKTYDDEIEFYKSNIWNFPYSEVAWGNLGATYLKVNLPGSAFDCFQISTRINPHYDVGWYNLFNMFKGQGDLKRARECLVKCLDSKTVHYQEMWQRQLDELDMEIAVKEEKANVSSANIVRHTS